MKALNLARNQGNRVEISSGSDAGLSVGRVLNVPYGEVDQIAKLVPSVLGIKLSQAIEDEPRLKKVYNETIRKALQEQLSKVFLPA